jgi:hypothetical protein
MDQSDDSAKIKSSILDAIRAHIDGLEKSAVPRPPSPGGDTDLYSKNTPVAATMRAQSSGSDTDLYSKNTPVPANTRAQSSGSDTDLYSKNTPVAANLLPVDEIKVTGTPHNK